MNKTNKTPNRKIRTIILGCILLVYLGSIIYVAITKDNNNLDGSKTKVSHYEDKYYDDYYDDEEYDYYNDEEYDDYYDDSERELAIDSYAVQSIYEYIKTYPFIPNFKSNFEVSELTQEEKMILVSESLHSKNVQTSQTIVDATEQQVILNNRVYYATTPNLRYETYEVVSMYSDIFGSSYDFDYSTIMRYGYDVIYKYDELANGFIKYVAADQTPLTTTPTAEVVNAIKRGNKLELYLKVANQTEKYTFELLENTQYTYKLTGRTISEEKNSL